MAHHRRRRTDSDNGRNPYRMVIYALLIVLLLGYGYMSLTSPSTHDAQLCRVWQQQYEERVNGDAIFRKVGSGYRDTTITSNGMYSTVEIRITAPCRSIPAPLDAYLTDNKLGAVMFVRLVAEGEEKPCCSVIY